VTGDTVFSEPQRTPHARLARASNHKGSGILLKAALLLRAQSSADIKKGCVRHPRFEPAWKGKTPYLCTLEYLRLHGQNLSSL
jgi:hypothetical protein